MPIASCSICGTPFILGKKSRWCPDGSIRSSDDAALRMVFLDTGELNNLFDALSGQLGTPVDHFLQEGCREFSHRYMSLLLHLLNRRDLEHFPGEESMFSMLCDHMRVWGMASPTISDYRDHEGLSLELLNSFNPTFPCGYFSGASEVLEGSTASCTWDGDAGAGRLDIQLTEDSRPLSELTGDLVMDDAGKGNIELPCCPECGVPQQISRISWNTDAGLITDLVNGRRVAMLGADILGTTLSLMTEQLGDHVPWRVVEIEREYARDVFFQVLHTSQDPWEMRARFAALGHGDVTATTVGDNTVFKIRHPFNPYFMAGRILGFYEAWRKSQLAASWRVSEWGTVYVTIYN